ncbi:MAG: EthD domain-containing protein [Candidatus Binatia bacterium]
MVKLVFCLRRLPHLSRAEFQRYWRETHGPLVRKHGALHTRSPLWMASEKPVIG